MQTSISLKCAVPSAKKGGRRLQVLRVERSSKILQGTIALNELRKLNTLAGANPQAGGHMTEAKVI